MIGHNGAHCRVSKAADPARRAMRVLDAKRANATPMASALTPVQGRAGIPSVEKAQAACSIRASSQCDQISDSALISRSMSPSVCTGDGVTRRRSVPTGTVG